MDNVELIKRQLAAFAASNWDEYGGYFADNAKYEELSTRSSATGRDNCVNAIKKWKDAFPDGKAEVCNTFSVGDTVITEVKWTGTQSGAMEGPLGKIQPTGKRGTVRAVLVSKIENGKIAEIRHYFDLMTVLGQLGVMSGMGAKSEQTKGEEARPSAH